VEGLPISTCRGDKKAFFRHSGKFQGRPKSSQRGTIATGGGRKSDWESLEGQKKNMM